MSVERVLWVGRVIVSGDSSPRSVRVWTDGAPPGPSSLVEEIDDPFLHGQGEVWAAAHTKPAAHGLAVPLRELTLAPPVRPHKVIGVGRNYRAHAEEMGNAVPENPLLFLKAPTCLLASGQPIELPRGYERIDMEAELVVVIGRRGRCVPLANAWEHVGGYALGNDVSCRDLQRKDKQWTRAKGFDGFGPLGPFARLTPPGTPLATDAIKIRGYLDDILVQEGSMADMIFDIPTLIAHITEFMTLEPGDLIYTGTPAGVSALSPGAVTRVETEGLALGRLTNPVV